MYFIIEGTAAVYDETDNYVIARLPPNSFFGETAIASGHAGLRTRSIKAETNLSIAILELSDFNLCLRYPSILRRIEERMEQRKKMNENKIKKNRKKAEFDDDSG
eukprot:CAMPEP_0114596290 /NCGR_PEP_ID=MMETSP0125-20121206/18277_1 /TAXON_ID=485358 ORGANISM="Aristerostoma sp., Strain ATCC 50986" /NCGR_SAMPLE_ID=MMETSP0125 /ASSEMBLY_ACC=CAM_ASM_000245 /LENGTH=104 /DNA_ID=CAMNT_0001799107 /DNA_START=155 /DNA_END=465 /DNA_ORIENTATION=+